MKPLLNRGRDESGQVIVFVPAIMVLVALMAALVVDVGSWYQADRKLQTAVDAAALAGAQELPRSRSLADSSARTYAQENYAGSRVNLPPPPDSGTIGVEADADTPGIFAPMLGGAIDVTVHAEAQARAYIPLEMKNVVPIAIHVSKACTESDCIGDPQTLTLIEHKAKDKDEDGEIDHAKSKFGLLDLDLHDDKTANSDLLNDWIRNGCCEDPLSIDTYYPSANGEKKTVAGQPQKPLNEAVGRTLLFPVYDTSSESGGYHVIAWAAFILDNVGVWGEKNADGEKIHELEGRFVKFIPHDLASDDEDPNPDHDFGVKVITLTK